ncbi:GlmL-related ornithine degradation protein [Acididesulfobacillus acetoxydans]|uniref:GlmL-related ornithine degradation protein n=1 Tax=Acididesulfobacillus acetoxydans TaxID=1561005 RepID=UPI001F0EE8C2|nr:GlmL-related ornithine degradation protein [Acididesulfobacillus acetoxydans]
MNKVLVAEIGSTTTVVNAFGDLESEHPLLLGQGMAPTTVPEGDVRQGLRQAVADLEKRIGPVGTLGEVPFYATSSAAGGLKMTVHGLVPEMTARAAREAALGAGAVLRYQTAGELEEADWREIERLRPNIMLLAGGVDHGDKRVVTENARKLADWFRQANWKVPVVYAGNAAAANSVREILEGGGLSVRVVANVYPDIDELNIEPTRAVIQEVFEQHITEAPGMQAIREIVNGGIRPTPEAVLQAARLIYEEAGDVLIFDVGGATTDVHSVTTGAEENQRLALAPEPLAKRTVEGDLGVYVNAGRVADLLGADFLRRWGENWRAHLRPLPEIAAEIALSEELASAALVHALRRHAGRFRHYYGASGRITRVEGRDLSRIRWVIGTGGALTRLPNGLKMMKEAFAHPGEALFPQERVAYFLDQSYIMASLGVLSRDYRQAAWRLLLESLGVDS